MQEYTSRSGINGSNQLFIKTLATMIHDEPVIYMGIRTLQAHCLGGGLELRFGNSNAPPTPNFQRHIDKYYLPFCREAIVSFLAVGFVPYRIRKTERGLRIPEVLPLGTFSWHVGRGSQGNLATPWTNLKTSVTSMSAQTHTKKQKIESNEYNPKNDYNNDDDNDDDQPILKYIVNSVYCSEKIHCFAFVNPQITFSCTSQLASLIQPYITLCQKRDCTIRADTFNSQPGLVLEQQDKIRINDTTEKGSSILNTAKDIEGSMDYEYINMTGRQKLIYEMFEEYRNVSNLPHESVAIVAPKNHSVHSIEKVLTPKEMLKEELSFARIVALALGLPSAMLLQGGGVVGGSSGLGSAKDSWAENTEASNRLVLDTCRHINSHLEKLLEEIYSKIYKDGGAFFKILLTPTIPFEQLLMAYESRMVEEKSVSKILYTTWGFPLSKNAEGACLEKRKAEFILPFKDKKTDGQ